jgi:hypothetical protein
MNGALARFRSVAPGHHQTISAATGRCRLITAMAMKTPPTIAFCTGNQKKKEEVVAILAAGGKLPFEVEAVKIDLPELQVGPSVHTFARGQHACMFTQGRVCTCTTSIARAASASSATQHRYTRIRRWV